MSVSNRFGVAKSSLVAYAVNALGYVLTVLRIRLRGYESRSIYDFWKLAGSGEYIVDHRTFFCKILDNCSRPPKQFDEEY
jgi:hypothetical protein